MAIRFTDYLQWARSDWQNVDFGDKRLNERAIKIGSKFLNNPFVSPPKMLKSFKDLKAFYRFMDSEKVSHEKLVTPHVTKTKGGTNQHRVVLAVQDTTTITFNKNYSIKGTYDVGNIKGLVVHNTISVIPGPKYGLIDGLLNQIIHKRKPKEKRTKKDNEIKLWLDSIRAIKKTTDDTLIIDVMDRGADAAEVMDCSLENNHEFIVRASYNRFTDHEEQKYLFDFARSLPVAGQKKLKIKGKNGRKTRKAKLNISFSNVTLKSPKNKRDIPPIKCNIIRVKEVETEDNEEPIEWFILTSLKLESFEDASRVIRYYSYRWIIEEYHKCMKTGFRIEETQMKELKRIEALLGFIAVSSVKLLQMRDIVRNNPDSDALKYVDKQDISIVTGYYELKNKNMTIETFLRYIAQMGGFLNRRNDGNPGWQSIWEGWKFFSALKEGIKLYKEGRIYG